MLELNRRHGNVRFTMTQCNCGTYHKDGKGFRVYVGGSYLGWFSSVAKTLIAVAKRSKTHENN